ncbi:integrase/recombinase XerC [Sphingomonas melonis]|uniref:Integrase/recombinase XerC n=2 Tax=Sphingomonas melonis TaxID=152682 RepID=A0A7Y9FKV4_9SPHN|nr:integrase/recombinase XerC [Sphingomonas melonis]
MRPAVARIVQMHNPGPAEEKTLAALGPHAALPGFYYVIDAESQEIHQATFFHLYSRHARDGAVRDDDDVPSFASNRAAAYELVEWLRFLAHVKHGWKTANNDLFALYANLLASNLSYQTGRKRQAGSIAHKLTTVYNFYHWTNAAGLTSIKWDTASIRSQYARAGRERREACDDEIRPFSAEEMRKLLAELGPVPSQRPANSLRPCRNRLLFETGLMTGMRGEEICNVKAKVILALRADADHPDGTVPLKITVTKRRKHRYIALPNSLILELQEYIRNERAEAMKVRIERGLRDEGTLFVNAADHKFAGAKLTTQSIHKLTHSLMLRLGFSEPGRRLKDGVEVEYDHTLHSFHDTRHSYAVNLYISQKRAGDPKPWETVQKMLGHETWLTTEKYYTRSVGVFEPALGVTLARYWEQEDHR